MAWIFRLLGRPGPGTPAKSPKRGNAGLRRRATWLLAGALVVLIGAYAVALYLASPRTPGNQLGYDRFLTDARTGQVSSAEILAVDHRVIGTYDGGRHYWVSYGSDDVSALFSNLVTTLDNSGVPYGVDQQWSKGLLAGPAITAILPALVLVVGLALLYLIFQGGGLLDFGRSGSRKQGAGESERQVGFSDVAGQPEAVEELAEIRDFLAAPERFLALGATPPRGVLLVGPPGCGKTLLAKAVAGEAGAGFFSISASAFVEMYAGVGAARIRDLFREARAAAPAIVFIDELDAVGRGRMAGTVGGQEERESALNELLVALDGFDTSAGVVVLAATNRPDILDPALVRPGRFDRQVTVDLPDRAGRRAILAVHVGSKPLARGADLDALARSTPGFSGADLAAALNEAALLAARRHLSEIDQGLLVEAVERVVAGPERRSRVLSVADKSLLAYHEAGHALVASVLSPGQKVAKVSIVGRGRAGGFTWFDPEDEQLLATADQLHDRLAVLLGGRAGEEVGAGQAATSADDDLARAALLARRMVAEWGMSELVGPVSLKASALASQAELPGPSPELAGVVDSEVRRLLVQAQSRARATLEAHRGRLEVLAARLEEAESVDGAELTALLGPLPEAVGG